MSAFLQSHKRTVVLLPKYYFVNFLKSVGALAPDSNVNSLVIHVNEDGGMQVVIESDIVQSNLKEVQQ